MVLVAYQEALSSNFLITKRSLYFYTDKVQLNHLAPILQRDSHEAHVKNPITDLSNLEQTIGLSRSIAPLKWLACFAILWLFICAPELHLFGC